MKKPVSSGELFGIAIRLSFSLRDEERSSRTLFLTETLGRDNHSQDSKKDLKVFPTNLNIQKSYIGLLDEILFFTPDLSEIYRGKIFDLYSKKKKTDTEIEDTVFTKYVTDNSTFTTSEEYKNWFIIEDLKEIYIQDIQSYYVYGTNYSLADKLLERAFPRIYYSDTAQNLLSYNTFCPYCGAKMGSNDFNYCPFCGSSLINVTFRPFTEKNGRRWKE